MDPSSISTAGAINGLYHQPLSAQASAKQPGKESQQEANNTSSAVDTIKIGTSTTLKNLDTVRTIEQMHAHLNLLAKGIRETNESINKATEQVDAMKSSLQVIIKNFPPFSIDSEERIDRLMDYTSLRNELLSLMIPPPPPAPYEKVKHLWDALFDQNGKVLPAAVPSLETSSSDEQLNKVNQDLDTTSMQLTDLSNQITQTLFQP
ncbi:MAG: hypothetical protein A2X80_06585 [Geobacteraceae bacterium GWB2_52_12]|nr:MAG: hypothetical protein A2X80_06585 [Geobacteraceae bacterium GWB2_52_12]